MFRTKTAYLPYREGRSRRRGGGVAMRAPMPSDEQERLRALQDLELMRRRPEPDLDGIVELTAGVCGTPVSLVSIIDADRHTVRAGYGIDLTDEPRDDSLCAH